MNNKSLSANEIDTFTRAYIECALWSTTDNSDDSGGEPLDANYSVEDIAPDTLAEMVRDCVSFQSDNADLMEEMTLADDGRAGHDFWLTRNRHGAGFWDGDWRKDIADRLTAYSYAAGSYDLYVGDDGKIYGN